MQSYDFSSLFGTQKRIDNLLGLSQLRQYTDQQRKVSRMLEDNFATSSATKTMADRLMGTIDTSAMNNAVAAQLKAAIPPDASQLMAERFRKSLGTATFGNQLAAQMPKVALPDSYLDVLRKQTFAFQNSAAYKQLLAGIDLGKMQMMLGQADFFREAVFSEAAEVADGERSGCCARPPRRPTRAGRHDPGPDGQCRVRTRLARRGTNSGRSTRDAHPVLSHG